MLTGGEWSNHNDTRPLRNTRHHRHSGAGGVDGERLMLLSNQELREKLGERQNRQVIKWLQDNRIQFIYDRKRRPITTLSAIERVLMNEQRTDEVDF